MPRTRTPGGPNRKANHVRMKPAALALLTALATFGAAALLPRPASATFPGPVGRIAYPGFGAARFPGNNSPAVCTAVPGSPPGTLIHDGWSLAPEDYAWSPDSSKLVFMAPGTAGNYSFAIGVVGADGSDYHLLTSSGDGLATGPGFSPDGQRIAFAWNPSGYGHLAYSVLAVMNADGSGKQALGTEHIRAPVRWSPDGTQLAFRNDGNDVVVSAANGADPVVVATGAQEPDWRPSGGQLAVRDGAGISTMNADGTMRTHIPGTVYGDASPAWSPDGAFVAFSHFGAFTGFSFPHEVDALRPDGSDRRVLVAATEMAGFPLSIAWGSATAAMAAPRACESPGAGTPDGGGGEGTIDSTRPRLSAPTLSPQRFRASGTGATSATEVGTRVSYTLSEAAIVSFRVQRGVRGRRVRGRCMALKRSDGRPTNCTRYKTLRGGFNHRGNEGPNRLRFAGRLNGRKLTAGHYYLRGVATDHAKNTSQPKRSRFQLVGG